MSSLRYRFENRKRTWGTLIRNFALSFAFLVVVYIVAQVF
jgi:hypothetical protein